MGSLQGRSEASYDPYSYEFDVLYDNVTADTEAQCPMQPVEDVDEEEELEEWRRVAQM